MIVAYIASKRCLHSASPVTRKGGQVALCIETPAPAQAEILRNPRAVKEARLELLREEIFEACGFIRIHAKVCQDLADAGDNAGLLHSLGRLISYAKHADRAGNELRELRKEPP